MVCTESLCKPFAADGPMVILDAVRAEDLGECSARVVGVQELDGPYLFKYDRGEIRPS